MGVESSRLQFFYFDLKLKASFIEAFLVCRLEYIKNWGVIVKKIFIITLSYLFLGACTNMSIVNNNQKSHIAGHRWIDMENIIPLIQYSEQNSLTLTNVFNFLGEPIYIEKFSVDNIPSTFMWYSYKTKFYPVIEIEASSSLSAQTKKQIKPAMISNEYKQWSDVEKWLLVIFNNEYHEIIFTSIEELNRKPRFNRDLILESKKYEKSLVKDLDPVTAKALLQHKDKE